VSRTASWRVVFAAVVVAGCTTGTPDGSDSTVLLRPVAATQTTSSSVTTTTTVPESTTTRSRSTTTTLALPPVEPVVPLDPTDYDGDTLVWVRAEAQFDRAREHWLGVVGDEFVVLSWRNTLSTMTVRRSADGVVWSEPVPAVGLPDGAPAFGSQSPEIAGGGAGLIMLVQDPPGWHDGNRAFRVVTSPDGEVWTERPVYEIAGAPFSVAAGDAGFAVVTQTGGQVPDPDRFLAVSGDDGEWLPVLLPDDERHLWWVAGIGDGFVAKGPGSGDSHDAIRDRHHYTIDSGGNADVTPGPFEASEFAPIDWDGSMLVWNQYGELRIPQHRGERPTLYSSSEPGSWVRLPFPAQEPTSDDPYGMWMFETFAAGPPGIISAGCNCVGFWDFYGESFYDFMFTEAGYDIHVLGDYVFLFDTSPGTENPVWHPPGEIDTATWFDPDTGMLTVPDPETGDTLATIACDEMRNSIDDSAYEIGPHLTDLPEQDLWYSLDGTSWTSQHAPDLFGDDSYVFQSAVNSDTAVLLVAPNGDRPIDDPPGCPMNYYPEEQPLDTWVTTLNNGP